MPLPFSSVARSMLAQLKPPSKATPLSASEPGAQRMVRRVLVVLAAGDAYPSGFIRGLIYQDSFRRGGLEVTYVSRLFPPLVRLLDTPPRFLWRLMAAGLRGV